MYYGIFCFERPIKLEKCWNWIEMCSVIEKIHDPDVVRGEIFVVYFLLFAICLLER